MTRNKAGPRLICGMAGHIARFCKTPSDDLKKKNCIIYTRKDVQDYAPPPATITSFEEMRTALLLEVKPSTPEQHSAPGKVEGDPGKLTRTAQHSRKSQQERQERSRKRVRKRSLARKARASGEAASTETKGSINHKSAQVERGTRSR